MRRKRKGFVDWNTCLVKRKIHRSIFLFFFSSVEILFEAKEKLRRSFSFHFSSLFQEKKKKEKKVDRRPEEKFPSTRKKEKQDNHSLFGDESSAQLFSLFYLLDFPPPQFEEKKRISSFFDAFFLSAVRRRCSKTTRTKRRRKYTLNLDGNEQTKYFLSATEKKKNSTSNERLSCARNFFQNIFFFLRPNDTATRAVSWMEDLLRMISSIIVKSKRIVD